MITMTTGLAGQQQERSARWAALKSNNGGGRPPEPVTSGNGVMQKIRHRHLPRLASQVMAGQGLTSRQSRANGTWHGAITGSRSAPFAWLPACRQRVLAVRRMEDVTVYGLLVTAWCRAEGVRGAVGAELAEWRHLPGVDGRDRRPSDAGEDQPAHGVPDR